MNITGSYTSINCSSNQVDLEITDDSGYRFSIGFQRQINKIIYGTTRIIIRYDYLQGLDEPKSGIINLNVIELLFSRRRIKFLIQKL